MPRIKRLEIKGFRAFGLNTQVLELRGQMAIIWGPNSQGKTSLAEAIEFLLTGKTVRRDLLASAKREFADALRNTYLPPREEVFVMADIEDNAGQLHRVKRRLVRDYTGRDTCQSELTINGNPTSDLSSLGIRLSQPPLEAPVLMPHTLRYVVSAEPQQRTGYFRALLEVSDLEEIRNAIIEAKQKVQPPVNPLEQAYSRCLSNPIFGQLFARLESGTPSRQMINNVLLDALAQTFPAEAAPSSDLVGRLTEAKRSLEDRRAKTFPVQLLEPRGYISEPPTLESHWQALENFTRAKAAVSQEVSRFAKLFETVLGLPEVANITAAVDCPVCKSAKALTPERIEEIRKQLEDNQTFRNARQKAENAINELSNLPSRLLGEARQVCPSFLSISETDIESRGLTVETIRSVLGDQAEPLLEKWEQSAGNLRQALEECMKHVSASKILSKLKNIRSDEINEEIISQLKKDTFQLIQSISQLSQELRRYKNSTAPFLEHLRKEIDKSAGTEGWQDLIDLVENYEEFLHLLIQKRAYNEVHQEIEKAITEIDQANAQVLDEKFDVLSNEIVYWWDLLRPGEPTAFDGIQRGGIGRRFIDLKARLNLSSGGSDGVLRDAVAVFSDSQLNALGLSAFLARTVREGTGFVILDDPVPATDDEHRAFFINQILNDLVKRKIQVILLTHDERNWKDIQEFYRHIELDTFLISMGPSPSGARVENRSDTFDALLTRAAPFIENPNPDIRRDASQKLRIALERFCKLLLVKERLAHSETTAKVSDYDGQNLRDLVPKVEPLLTKDPSHPGKLRVIGRRLNPGEHDHSVPSSADLKQCYGDLKYLRKEYLE